MSLYSLNCLCTMKGGRIACLDPKTLDTMMALGRDAEVGAKWRTETAIKGGSDSVANLFAAMGGLAGDVAKHVSLGMVAVEAITQGFEHGGVKGAAVGGAGAATAYLVNTLRSAGIKRVGDLYREALADPALARSLISKMPASADAGALHGLARTLKRGLIVGPMVERQAPGPAGSYTPPPAPAPRITVPHDHPILTKARRAPDGFMYVPDPRMQGRLMRVGP